MRNLKRIQESTLKFEGISAIAYDLEDLVIAFGPSHASPSITLKRLGRSATSVEDASTIASWDATSDDYILDIHCFPDAQIISVILAGGDIITVKQDAAEDQIEILGSVDAGIAAVAWSPDEELVAIATKAETLLFMTRDFDLVSDATFSLDDIKVSDHVSVGWGKKETQFKGRGVAKTLRDPTMPEHVDEGSIDVKDDLSVTLSWRGDGQYLATNSVIESEPRRRMIRVFSREGVLESVSEPVNGLESALSWRPSGQTIAGVRKVGSSVDVVLFERNGLRHGEFSLRLSPDQVDVVGKNTQLSWNQDSSVLAVVLADRVQLWTTGNYHWYLKQEIQASHKACQPQVAWHPEHPLQLSVFDHGELVRQRYTTAVARGPVIAPHDHGLVAVIDGTDLKITPLRTANIPPPMAQDEIKLPDCANDVAFDQDEDETLVQVLFANGSTSSWKYVHSTKHTDRATAVSNGTRDAVTNGDNISALELHYHAEETLPHGLGEVSLSESGLLQVAGLANIRVPGVTSYIATDLYLIFTTSNHLLKFIHLSEEGELQIPLDEPEKDERCRSIERGAKIVTVMPSAYSLVLQMPRGNLETIYPRALILTGIRQAIGGRQYKKAFSICRAHRVDMNILHDYAPDQFMENIPLFLKQIKNPAHVDLFLSSLSDEDVTQTIYKETLQQQDSQPTTNGHFSKDRKPGTSAVASLSKVNGICEAFHNVLRQQKTPSLQNIITAHVCKNPPDLEAGLALISDLRRAEDQDHLEQAVEHISFLSDVNQLYDTALGLYDLEVTLLVAQQSQKDPREYLPYLQKLQDMPDMRRQYTIDDDLRRYEKALSHLHALGDFVGLKKYMVKHDLYTAAMELFRYDAGRLGEIILLQAEYFSSRNRYAEAGVAYEYVQEYTSAYEAYRSAGMWRECLSSAALVPISEEVMSSLAYDVASNLEEAKDFSAAATVQLDYMKDLAAAMRLLCRGFQFSEALRLAALHRKQELLPSILDPGLIEASATMTEMLAEMKSQLRAQAPRLQELRQKKAEDPMAFLDGADGGDDDIPDNLSLAPTNASTTGTFMTRYTNQSTGTLATNATRKTSKNKRREERKRARGKKGTVYEEEYLVNSITRLVERLNDTSADISRLIDGLLRRAMRERALAVDKAMVDVVEACRGSLNETFASGMPSSGSEDQHGEVRPQGGQGVLWDALVSSGHGRSAPVLKAYQQSSLLV
ncbi:putative elongator complex protein 1 [Recurvomyces mirabilis]|uniref:Elongator complex protein 1 n=1 Tax=Recurvomyces mirabilis TaxID=574656 RepID=A0AAE0WLE4_9PEZI|nr:putative elongator complex protein 1 [Recurvomyces mirabilis]KAK5152291.1 putative elongator complex protein 1 [Recurvomyces mirabilis]